MLKTYKIKNMKKIIFISIIILAVFSSCRNQDWSFPNYDYSTVYFAYQYPVRTIELGDDNVVDNSFDNAHKCQIMGTFGGAYSNGSDIKIGVQVDNSLCDGLSFSGGGAVMPMPSNYYTLASNQIVIPKGSIMGGVEVQLTDAFFADPLAINATYVIPLVMTSVQNADSILCGTSAVDNPNRCVASDWSVTPKDYTLYAVKYVNPWDANYLRRGVDIITKNGATATTVRHQQYVEYDEVIKLTTLSMTGLELPTDYQNGLGDDLNMKVNLNFDNDQKCTVAPPTTTYQIIIDTPDPDKKKMINVFNITATGNGQFIKDGDKNSWGNQDRNVLYLSYKTNFDIKTYQVDAKTLDINSGVLLDSQSVGYTTTDTLVVRDRGISMETFNVVHN